MKISISSFALVVCLAFRAAPSAGSVGDELPAPDSASGSVTSGGQTFTLRHAYLCSQGSTTVEVCLSGAPTTHHVLERWTQRVESAREGNPIVVVRFLDGRANLVEVYEGRTEQGFVSVVDPAGESDVRLTGPDTAEGTLSLRGQAENGPMAIEARFRSGPAPSAGVGDVIDRALDRAPMVRGALDWVMNRAFPFIVAAAVLVPIAALLYWSFVVVPRRASHWFDGLERSGWTRAAKDDPEMTQSIRSLGARYRAARPLSATEPGDRSITRAVTRIERGGARHVARVRQWVVESGAGSSRRTNTLHTYFVIAEPRRLRFARELYITERVNDLETSNPEARDPALDARPVTEGLEPDFARLYSVCARGSATMEVPLPLQRAFVELAPSLTAPEGRAAPKWLINVNTRFTFDGWGLSCGQLTSTAHLDALLEVAERLSAALDDNDGSSG